jgi:hypothetical protein
LAAARLGLELPRARIEGEVASAQLHPVCRARPRRGDFAAVGRGAAVDAIVEAPAQAVQHRLHVELVGGVGRVVDGKPGEDDLPHIGLAVAVGVFEKDHVGRGGDVDPAVGPEDAGRPRQIVGKHRALVETPVFIRVFQHADAAPMGLLVTHLGVIHHLDHKQASVLVEADLDGIADERFGGDELEAETGADFERLERLPGLDRREAPKLLQVHLRLSGPSVEQ